MVSQFINQYGITLVYGLVTALAGFIGVQAKKIYEKYANTREKKAVVKTAVRGVKQLYQELDGAEKLKKATEAAEEMLAERGIKATALELRMLIEEAVCEMKEAFSENG